MRPFFFQDKNTNILSQLVGVPHAAFLSVVFGLFLASFPMGVFVVFASDIGDEIHYDLPLTHLGLFSDTGLYLAPFPLSVGDAFVILWMTYLVIFMIGVLGPARGFGSVMSDVMAGRGHTAQASNYMFGAIAWFSILVLASIIITVAQDYVGIPTIRLLPDNGLEDFFYITLAPLVEELGFRLILVGIPVFLMYAHWFSPGYFARSLWRPATLGIEDKRKAVAVVVAVAVLFGFLHIALGESWSEGKFAQAAVGGVILGWVYIRYGFAACVIIHWAANYFVFSNAHFISQTHDILLEDAFSHAMTFSIEIILVVCGVLSVAALYLSSRTHCTEHVQGGL